MKKIFSSLYARLSLWFVLLFFVTGFAFLLLTHWSNNRYYQEITQNLNKSLAMYIVQRAPLISQGLVNEDAMKELGTLAMVVNPIVEVYLLDTQGNLLSSAVPKDTWRRTSISLTPILQYLNGEKPYPITGDDPRSTKSDRIFSVFPIHEQGKLQGYLYVILGGKTYQSLRESIGNSYIVQQSLVGLIALICFAIASSLLIFAVLTSPIRKLAKEMNQFHHRTFDQLEESSENRDEIQHLAYTFAAMQARIDLQLAQLQETDKLRRELISNVSHDLRTPISSMQGYLEMLMRERISPEEQQQYTQIAYKNCHRLTKLVMELFELSKLDAGRIQPQYEYFSLAELAQDIIQKFSLSAQQKNITLSFQRATGLTNVYADIGLIERVIDNLLDNALRYTPEGGKVELSLNQRAEQVDVCVKDNGIGVPEEDIPYIFERYYRAQKPSEYNHQSTGLGLAIVKRILELHSSQISVESTPAKGTFFSFPLQTTATSKAA